MPQIYFTISFLAFLHIYVYEYEGKNIESNNKNNTILFKPINIHTTYIHKILNLFLQTFKTNIKSDQVHQTNSVTIKEFKFNNHFNVFKLYKVN